MSTGTRFCGCFDFCSRQIKHRATIGGNLCNASPIGDLAPVLMSYDATVILASEERGEREIPLSEFFLDYRKTDLRADEVLIRIFIPRVSPKAKMSSYKLSRRREMDISAVSAGLRVELTDDQRIGVLRLCFGGIGAVPTRLSSLEGDWHGREWNETTVEEIALQVDQSIAPISDHRASEGYRRRLVSQLY